MRRSHSDVPSLPSDSRGPDLDLSAELFTLLELMPFHVFSFAHLISSTHLPRLYQ
jgi:hypothetical protein